MAVAIQWVTRGPTGTAEKYDELLAVLGVAPGGPHPGEGCLFHWCRVDHDGLHGVDVWDTQAHFDAYVQNILGPAVAQIGMTPPHTESFDIHAYLTAH
jgi:hypothetical protein